MLPKQNRLNLKKERFFKGESEFSCAYFRVLKKKGKNESPKIGFIVSKRVGNAVSRNKVKRTFSEILVKNLGRVSKDSQLIFIAFPKSAGAPYSELVVKIEECLLSLKALDRRL
jgi:ribonuclease P protein component